MSGVRSSCERLSMNSVLMRWSRRSSDTSRARARCHHLQWPGADCHDRSVRSGGADLGARRARARLGGSSGQALDRRVHERFHQRAPADPRGDDRAVRGRVRWPRRRAAMRRAHDPDVQGLSKGLVIGCTICQLADPVSSSARDRSKAAVTRSISYPRRTMRWWHRAWSTPGGQPRGHSVPRREHRIPERSRTGRHRPRTRPPYGPIRSTRPPSHGAA